LFGEAALSQSDEIPALVTYDKSIFNNIHPSNHNKPISNASHHVALINLPSINRNSNREANHKCSAIIAMEKLIAIPTNIAKLNSNAAIPELSSRHLQ
jgi:hypothetical protein